LSIIIPTQNYGVYLQFDAKDEQKCRYFVTAIALAVAEVYGFGRLWTVQGHTFFVPFHHHSIASVSVCVCE
jgi:hypothetical protein